MGTNTGKPGFVIEPGDVVDESLSGVYNYDVGAPDRPDDPSYPDTSTADKKGDINVTDTSGHDLSQKTRVTLSSYLGKKTQKNYYRIDPETADVTLNIENESTSRLTPPPEQSSEYKWFSSGKKVDLPRESPELKGWSPNGRSTDPEPELATLLKKGKLSRSSGEFDGNSLLPEAKGAADRKIENYTRSVLANNRFTSSSRAVPKAGTRDQSSPSDVEAVTAARGYNPTFHHPLHGQITANSLANIGVELMLRASQDSFGKNPTSDSAIVGAALPSANQLGITKIEAVKLHAVDVIKSLTKTEAPESQFTSQVGSWGSLNNVHDQFSGMSSVGMVALTVALQTSVLGVVFGVSKTISLMSPEPQPQASTGNSLSASTNRKLGSSDRGNTEGYVSNVARRVSGLTKTINPYVKCVEKGTAAFFGYDDLKLDEQVDRFVSSAGYYAVLCRSIIRSSAAFLGSVENSVNQTSPLDAAKSLVLSTESLSTSKVVAALNMFASIGDVALEAEKADLRTSEINEAVSKNSSAAHGSLSYLTNRSSTSLYMLPRRLMNLNDAVSKLDGQMSTGFLDPGASKTVTTTSPRLSPGSVIEIEKVLDTAYMPFYFHDLRTNEIISFHAFLENISDSYAASYEQTPGFGRVESVKTYKDTARKIGVSFYVVAVDPLDFEHMWAKINKLTTFVYPQYTEGRRVRVGNSEFVQPFSQMQATSPLIRIRLGNLLRSNYTKFALARLFGATLDGVKFDGVSDATLSTKDADVSRSLYYFIESKKSEIGTVWNSTMHDSSVLFKITRIVDANSVHCSVVDNGMFVSNIDKTATYLLQKNTLLATKEIVGQYNNLSGAEQNFFNDQDKSEIVNYAEKVQNFFSDKSENAIVKSFNSTSGKGLAGFVDQLDFDWTGGNKIVWDIDVDKKVPMMCKVTMGFMPVHDISPGIDSQGYNRAPIYPVGIHSTATKRLKDV